MLKKNLTWDRKSRGAEPNLRDSVHCKENNLNLREPVTHRRRMEREAKAKVVAYVWGQILFNSLPR